MRSPIVAGNWKMNLTGAQALALAGELTASIAPDHPCEFLIAPGALALARVAAVTDKHPRIGILAQSCHGQASGAYTGWLAAEQARDAGATALLVGHSERRQYAHESHRDIALQLAAARRTGMRAILCVGEDLAERERGATEAVLRTQLDAELAESTAADAQHLVIAYEPVWAIGTGHAARPDDVAPVHALLRAWLSERWGQAGADVPLLYGGSVTPDSAATLGALDDVDGFLVGGQSLKAQAFVRIAARLIEAKR